MSRLLLILLIAAAIMFAACGDDDDKPSSSATQAASATSVATNLASPAAQKYAGKSITVFAASSLTESFNEIGPRFTTASGAAVTFSFGGSSDLRAQLEQGAAADVFASADTKQMGMARDSGVVADAGDIFAGNRLVVIVPKANSANIATLQDLAKSGIKIALADETVPVGKYARQFLDNASADPTFGSDYKDKVLANVVTNASNVKEVVTAVQLDEVDAGIVYTTDVTSAVSGDVTRIAIADNLNVIATYPIDVTTHASETAVAQAFVDYVLGAEGEAVLKAHGFLAPQ
jgi:molybdate transport system substrate-binding protein